MGLIILDHEDRLEDNSQLPLLTALPCFLGFFFNAILISEITAEERGSDVGALSAGGFWLLILLRRLPGGPPVHPPELQEAGGEGTHRLSWKTPKQVKNCGEKNPKFNEGLRKCCWMTVKESTATNEIPVIYDYSFLLALCRL